MDERDPVATRLLEGGRCVLRLDAGDRELSRHLRRAGLPGGAAVRDAYRRLLIETPGLAAWVGGVLLPTDLPRDPGTPSYVQAVRDAGLLPGARADVGASTVPGHLGAFRATLPDDLDRELDRLAGLGMAFLTWRSVVVIHAGRPPEPAVLRAAADTAARFAARCLRAGPLPVLAVEVLMDGDHDLALATDTTADALAALGAALTARGVPARRVLVATGLAIEGVGHPRAAAPPAVAAATVQAVSVLPAGLAGSLVLPGAQRHERLVANLAALRATPPPLPIAPLCGRALTGPLLAAWRGRAEAVDDTRARFVRRLAQLVPAGAGAHPVPLHGHGAVPREGCVLCARSA